MLALYRLQGTDASPLWQTSCKHCYRDSRVRSDEAPTGCLNCASSFPNVYLVDEHGEAQLMDELHDAMKKVLPASVFPEAWERLTTDDPNGFLDAVRKWALIPDYEITNQEAE